MCSQLKFYEEFQGDLSYSRGEQLNMADEAQILSISLMSLLSFNRLFGRILCQI